MPAPRLPPAGPNSPRKLFYYIRQYLNRLAEYIDALIPPGGGEANDGANVGTGAGLVYRDKILTTLNFRRMLAGTNMTITTVGDDVVFASTGGTQFNIDGGEPGSVYNPPDNIDGGAP